MAYNGLKPFISRLREEGELHEIEAEVDPSWEVGAICREVFDRQGPALVFKKVGQHRTPLVVGVFTTLRRYALALGCPPDIQQIRARWDRAYQAPIKPMVVGHEGSPCKQVKLKEVDLYGEPFPVPRWHKQDSNPYLGTFHAVVTRDPETGWTNVGDYRNELRGKDILGLLCIPYRHIGLHWEKWRQLGKAMPIAIAIGVEPYLSLVSVSAVPAGIDEYDIAGALKGEPIQVTQAETSDLLVPANAEIIIEGEVPVDDLLPFEGPFGEFAGYMGDAVANCQYVKVKAVTHQERPYFQATYEGRPPNESTTVRSIGRSMALYRHLVNAGITGIQNVCVTPGGCAGFHAVVAIKKSYPGHVRDVMCNVWGHPTLFCKHVVVVDDDIDPWDPFRVEWAVSTTVRAGRDIEIVKGGKSIMVDPSSPRPRGGFRGAIESDLLGIDATRPVDVYEAMGARFPDSTDPAPELMEEVRRRWKSYGFSD
ncbi:MAG: UbiD family decarboxylase [Dehalococcoidia bacterium]|nr:UbiD family decarboxylase [Dehalococcoidia bacterium]